MNLNIDGLTNGIRTNGNTQETAHAQGAGLSSFVLSKGAGAGSGRVQDVIAVDLETSAFGSNAYAQRKRSAGDLTEAAGQGPDIDAMVVLAHTLSPEDYEQAMRDGYQPGDGSCEETVTIMDHIRTAMLRAGNEVPGFTDQVDRETLIEITGSEAFAEALEQSFVSNDLPYEEETFKAAADALEQAAALSAPDDAAVKYMVENRMEPTIRSFILSEAATNGGNASAGGYYLQEGGYYALKAGMPDFESLAPQIDAVVEEAGYTSEEAGDQARRILANDMPLTVENLKRMMTITGISFPVETRLASDAVAAALADGREPLDANLADPVSLAHKALLLARSTELAQARLSMSVEANLQLLRHGIAIDTLPVEKQIDALQAAREEIAGKLFAEEEASPAVREELRQVRTDAGIPTNATALDKLSILEETAQARADIRLAPVSLIGSSLDLIRTGTLRAVADAAVQATPGSDQQTAPGNGSDRTAARALAAYETVGTEVRADLGDSIRKAFRNVPDILRELGMEENADNARAVRILGHNGMEITRASVEEIRAEDAKLKDVTDRLKPGAVLSMIRDGVNPMKLTLDELKQELDERQQEGDTPAERYARFLMQLEHKGEITEQERSSYIGIYRLFRQLKKTDHAAIGSVLEEGGEMTIGNLLTAMRSKNKAGGIDARVDDAFGGVEGSRTTPSISAQIEAAFTYYSSRADSIYEHMDADRLHAAHPTQDTTIPELADALEASDPEEAAPAAAENHSQPAAEEWSRMEASRIRETLASAEAETAAQELTDSKLPVTPNFIEAMRNLQAGRRRTDNVWDAMAKLADRTSTAGDLRDAMRTVEDAFSAGEQVEEVYKDKTQEMIDDLDRMMEDAETSPELKLMLLMKRQLTVAAARADRNSYDLPVTLDGELVNLHVTFEEQEGRGSLLCVGVPTKDHGVLTLYAAEGEEGLTGCLNSSAPDNRIEQEYLAGVRDRFLANAGTESAQIHLFAGVREGRHQQPGAQMAMEHETMFALAKAFVEAVR